MYNLDKFQPQNFQLQYFEIPQASHAGNIFPREERE